MEMNPTKVPIRIHQLVLQQLRIWTAGLSGTERIDKMIELAEKINERLERAINELEKDIEYRPQQFFGIVLWKSKILRALSALATLATGIMAKSELI